RGVIRFQPRRDIGVDPPGPCKGVQRIDRCGCTQRWIAAAVDELVNLREKLDLADAPAPALEVIAGTELLALGEMVADPVAHGANFLELTEIQAATPDERLDGGQKILAERPVARRRARTDEGRLLPGE